MEIEEKVKNPICIRLSRLGTEILPDYTIKKSYPLDPGGMIGGERYGFIIISDSVKIQKEDIYPTQCKIMGVGIEDGVLIIKEDGKYFPWKFTLDGKLLQCATFNKYSRSDKQYLVDNFSIYRDEDIEEINVTRKR